jgi:hypothetical protein
MRGPQGVWPDINTTKGRELMARIIVISDPPDEPRRPPVGAETEVLLDERVEPVHLRDSHAAGQLIERLTWAVNDAEHAPRTRPAAGAAAS